MVLYINILQKLFFLFLGVFSCSPLCSQNTIVKGSVKEASTMVPIPDVFVTIENTNLKALTDGYGKFMFTERIPLGEHILHLSKTGYLDKRYPIIINQGQTVNIEDMLMTIDVSEAPEVFTISLADDELNNDTNGADNISGLLHASKDVFQRTVAFEFSSSFFKMRGLDSDHSTVMLNGVEMNKQFNGRPQWSNWGGLNDMMRNQELSSGITPSSYSFGGILGTTNVSVRASEYRAGGRFTYSSSNRSYVHRLMASYASGLLKNGWAFALMISRRWGDEGYQDATVYDSNSFFVSVEKQFGDKHSLNLSGIYTPNRRGKSSPNTQEVYDLKGISYNEYWGILDGEKHNSRIKEVKEPIIMLNHYWDISSKINLNTNFAYQFGKLSNSRLDYPGGSNPSPTYYQKLPSYFLADPDSPDYDAAYQAEQDFIENGQMDWERILDANLTNNINGVYSAYVLYEDKTEDSQLMFNSILSAEFNENILFNGGVKYRSLISINYAEILDMLGSETGYLNVDAFDGYQYDYRNPDAIIDEGGKIRYNYKLNANVVSAFAQARFKYNRLDFYLAGSFRGSQYQRKGLFQNEANVTFGEMGEVISDNSYGKGEKLKFKGFGGKIGATYKLTGNHLFDLNAAYVTKAPSLKNTYTNVRVNQDYIGVHNGADIDGVDRISEEKITASDISYIYRTPIIQARLTGFYVFQEDGSQVNFYYADGLSGFEDENGFLQSNDLISETLQGVDKKHLGGELGIDAQVTQTIMLKAVASLGHYTYDNNPNLYVSSDSQMAFYGKSNLKGYKLSTGPQQAYSLGFEYRDPDYWWFGATVNFFSRAYLGISPLTRTKNFYLDSDGFPFNDYDEEKAKALLKQESFDEYMTVNLIGGKSWRVGDYYMGLFVSINNLLDEVYKTGGFEQGRSANYRELLDDMSGPKRVFGPKYWYGRGATYFVNLNFRY